MRWLVGLAILGVSPALAAAPQCAIPGPIQIAAADQAASTPTTHDPSPAPIAAKPDAKPTNALPSGLAGLPFVRHVAEAGATLIDLGTSHGLHMIAARHGSEFRVFSVLGNGQSGPSQHWGWSGRDRRLRVLIVGWMKSLSEAGAERAVVESAANLEQKIGAAS